MKTIRVLLTFLILTLSGMLPLLAQQQFNMPLLGHWDDDNIPPAWTGPYSECWGYAANGREYAFLGSTQGTYFFDITDPSNPVVVDYFKTRDTTTLVVNKDYATYSHYLYAVSDQGSNSLQIFDLQYLPDSVVKVYDDTVLSVRCHTVFVDNDRLYMCSNSRPNFTYGKMDIVSLADPENPVYLGTVDHPGFSVTHEAFVRNDTAYCSNGVNGLWIYNVKNPAAPSLISIIDQYPEAGYNHSSWLTDDSKIMAFTDETHGYGVKVYDISDLQNPLLKSIFRSNLLMSPDSLTPDGSIAHIPYIVGNRLLLSYYHDGVQVYDISDPANPVRVGYYDTCPENTNYASYTGCWGLYPFLPSRNIIASDIHNGLFIFDGKKVLDIPLYIPVVPEITLLQNPASELLQFQVNTNVNELLDIRIFDARGRLVLSKTLTASSGSQIVDLPLTGIACGVYVTKLQSSVSDIKLTSKFIKSYY